MESIKLPKESDNSTENIKISNPSFEEELISEDIRIAIGAEDGEQGIKRVLIKSVGEVKSPSYLIDMSEVGAITGESLRALQGMLGGGDTYVYIKNRTEAHLMGAGNGQELYAVLGSVVGKMYSNKCRVYVNSGQGFKRMKDMDVGNVRLNL